MGKDVNRQFSEGADTHMHDHFHKRLGNGDQKRDVRFHPGPVSTSQGLRGGPVGLESLGHVQWYIHVGEQCDLVL